MTLVTHQVINDSIKAPERVAEKRIEAERMHDVLLLLQNLVNNEEATVKLILDCLYDVASVNLINQKLRFRPLNKMMKLVARMSKPAFRVFAWYWFKKNCPQLIVNWLHTKVAFETAKLKPKEVAIEVVENPPYSPLQAETLNREIKHLRYQVKLLSGVSIVAIAALGIVVTWLNHNPQIEPLPLKQQVQPTKINIYKLKWLN